MLKNREFNSEFEKEDWLRSCAGKQAFPTENSAIAFRKTMHEGKLGRRSILAHQDWLDLDVYCCRWCCSSDGSPNWHLGNSKERI